MRQTTRGWFPSSSALVALVSWVVGCSVMSPMAALPATLPVDTMSEKLVVLGNAEGVACQRDVLFLFPLERDSSIYTAKARALASVQRGGPRRAIALIDVSIDHDGFTAVVYNRHCTVMRGRAVGYVSGREVEELAPNAAARPSSTQGENETDPVVVAASPVSPPSPGQREIAGQRPAVRACLSREERDFDVSVQIQVDRSGRPQSLHVSEKLSASTYACMLGVFKRMIYPRSPQDYVLAHRFEGSGHAASVEAGTSQPLRELGEQRDVATVQDPQ